ncbi:hypothetical protein ACT4ML_00675 [Natrinema sp. LN54]|uniref:hypothetical protein n=1 Tax=Natrinema sp. LN54 TaxID=3458705 RepID=UPI004036A23B
MNRRRMLSAIGGSVATLSLAGCLSDSGDDDSTSTDGEDDPVTLIESADETLNAAVDDFESAIDESGGPLNDGSYAIETKPIEAQISEAENDLSAARDGATDDQLATIGALEDVADFLRDFVDVFSALGDAMNELDTWEQYLDQERWGDAVSSAERAESYNDDAMDSATVARSTFDDIDTTALGAVDEVDRAEMEVALEEIEDVLSVTDVLFTGSRQMAEGMLPFTDAVDALEAERYNTAASEFSSAADTFNSAYTTFNEAESDAPAEFRSDLIDLSCQMNALKDAAEYYASGAEEYADGNYSSGDSYFSQGETAANRCDSNDVALSMN